MVTLLGPAELRDLADLLDLRPTKKLGQNFVHDANTVRRIVRAAGVEAGDEVLEVGPGLGSLTLGLLEAGARVTAVEIDSRLAARLPLTVAELAPDAPLTVLEADALLLSRAHLASAHLASAHPASERPAEVPAHPRRLVANLPYNVSVPVLLHLLAQLDLETALVMVQAEVGERIAAPPGSRVYGSPSAKAAWFGDWTLAGRVSRAVFWPVPNVDSVLVGYRRGPLHGTDDERRATFALVDAAFGQRRKMLRQSLREALGDDAVSILERADVDPTDRAERLGIDAFLRIARVVAGG